MVNSKHEKNIFLVYLFVFLHRISIIAHIDITVLANFRAKSWYGSTKIRVLFIANNPDEPRYFSTLLGG